MDILSLRYFIVSAEYSSFSKAAEFLYTTQPNISKHIQRLEEELKVKLFNRTGKNVELTDAGLKCLVEIRNIVEKVDLLKDNAYKYNLGDYGDIKIGYTGEFDYSKFSRDVSSYSYKYPNINVLFTKSSQSEILNLLLKDKLDIILTLATGLIEFDSICYHEIIKNKLVLIVPESHRFASLNFVLKKDFGNEPIIMFDRNASPYVYDELVKYLHVNNLFDNIVSYESNLQNMLLKVESRKGITFLTDLSLRTCSNMHVLNFEYDQKRINVNLSFVWKKDNKNPALSLFLNDFCK
ncbi:MAG: transcriptional regulator, LysR family [Bacillota bacterium]|nr:transcriptional regulator, LysR family [Bacillota bacterium]